jgi:hypothetical protein
MYSETIESTSCMVRVCKYPDDANSLIKVV